jgi:ketosteroid isomerase-like protein
MPCTSTRTSAAMALFVVSGLVASQPMAEAMRQPVPSLELAHAQLRALNHRFIDIQSDANGSLMDALTAQDFLLTEHDGSWRSRAEFLARRPSPESLLGAACDDVQVRLFGPVALVHGVVCTRADGKGDRAGSIDWITVRYTDVHVWRGTQWQLVSAQNTRLKAGVALKLQSATAPAYEPWAGQDPGGADLDVLHTLNDQYVNAFRNADVAWYAAHLRPDYVVTGGDGTHQDRAAALVHFAQPTFATRMKSFPVGKVNIRRFADVALIHAENDYELKDGRKGISRYTDIWHLRDGAWRCVAAHITVYKAPG